MLAERVAAGCVMRQGRLATRGPLEFLLDNVIVLGDKCYCLVNSVIQLVNCCDPAGRSLL